MEVTLIQILEARDRRVQKQKQLLSQFGKPLICFTMNIPGPVKRDDLIERGFLLGLRRLEAQLNGSGIPILHREQICAGTGCEAFLVADSDAKTLKNLCVEIEQADVLGRLFDMDVLDTDGVKLERGVQRTCLLCGKPAQVCGRSRAHTVPQLQEKVRQILTGVLNREDWQHIAQTAVKALLFEVAVTPKPGLVDRNNSGSHRDMDIFSFLASASTLSPYFETCARLGWEGRGLEGLRCPGKLAEAAMYAQTGNVNTHKGAIFSLGLLCAAAGFLGPERTAGAILSRCAQMAQGLTAELGRDTQTAGQRLYKAHGITGIRGQAERGFPTVRDIGLPVLETGISQGLSLNDAAMAALLHMLTQAQDTNLITRGGPEAAGEAVNQVSALLKENPYPTVAQVEILDRAFQEKNLSPGGTADLLSLTLFLYFLDRE